METQSMEVSLSRPLIPLRELFVDGIPSRKTMKQLTCRKCEGHGVAAVLKGHASRCPFNQCTCHTCEGVMALRASALVRRFRHRAPTESTALLKTIRSKNGNTRLRIVPASGRSSPGGTEVVYHEGLYRPPSRHSLSSRCSSPSPAPSSSSSSSPSPLSPLAMDFLRLFLEQSAFSLRRGVWLTGEESLLGSLALLSPQ